MTYKETVDFLFSQLPMFQRTGAAAYKPNLDRIEGILAALGNPESSSKYVHVAGTNGKGTICNLCAAMLQSAGYKTGLFTSPHFVDYRERIRINGEMIPEEYIVDFVHRNKKLIEDWQPSFFEWTTAIAFQYFTDNQCDIVILETGMGGRLDSTNVIVPEVAAITSIGLDHQQFLGDTLDKIAREKAGIIKKERAVIIGSQEEHVRVQLKNHAIAQNAKPVLTPTTNSTNWDLINDEIVELIRTELIAREFNVTSEDLIEGKKRLTELTGYWGRRQKLGERPTVIADTAHNMQAISALLDYVKTLDYSQLIVIYGSTHGDQIVQQFRLFPNSTKFVLTTAELPRMLKQEEISKAAEEAAVDYHFVSDPINALEFAKDIASDNDLILICGSVFIAAAYHPQNTPTELG